VVINVKDIKTNKSVPTINEIVYMRIRYGVAGYIEQYCWSKHQFTEKDFSTEAKLALLKELLDAIEESDKEA